MFVSNHHPASGLQPHLVIFDCDGVLVDSERIYIRVLNQFAAELGLILSEKEGMHLFKGVHLSQCRRIIEERCGKSFPANFEPEYKQSVLEFMENELTAVKDVAFALSEISVPICVASNSPLARVQFMLEKTGLLRYFGDRILSGHAINKFKPAPDLFLLAAKTFGAHPSNCLVVEDSMVGVQAARAAHMDVLLYVEDGFVSSSRLNAPQAEVFDSMRHLPKLVARTKATSKLSSILLAPQMVLPSPLLNATR